MSATYTYKIGEAAAKLQLKTHVLRFWETEFLQIVPLRTDKGQRLYTEGTINLLRHIKYLLHEQGLTIEGAKKSLASDIAKGICYDTAEEIPPLPLAKNLPLLSNDLGSVKSLPSRDKSTEKEERSVEASSVSQEPFLRKEPLQTQNDELMGTDPQPTNAPAVSGQDEPHRLSSRFTNQNTAPLGFDVAALGQHITSVVRKAVETEQLDFYTELYNELTLISQTLQNKPE